MSPGSVEQKDSFCFRGEGLYFFKNTNPQLRNNYNIYSILEENQLFLKYLSWNYPQCLSFYLEASIEKKFIPIEEYFMLYVASIQLNVVHLKNTQGALEAVSIYTRKHALCSL